MDTNELLQEFIMESGGYSNGHDQFMICGKNLNIEPLLKLIDDVGGTGLVCNGKITNTCISFDAYGIRFYNDIPSGDFLKDISKLYPTAVCYWNDCWDDEVDFDCMKNSKDYSKYTVEIEQDEDSDAEEDERGEYRSIEATIIDNSTGNEMYIGGGMVYSDYVKAFYEKLAEK